MKNIRWLDEHRDYEVAGAHVLPYPQRDNKPKKNRCVQRTRVQLSQFISTLKGKPLRAKGKHTLMITQVNVVDISH